MTASVIELTEGRLRELRKFVSPAPDEEMSGVACSMWTDLVRLIDAELSRRAVSEEVGGDVPPSRWAQEADKDSTHSDDHAVERFAMAMREKLARKRADGRGGWEHCSQPQLAQMLVSHIEKGDPVDIANFAMMIYHNELRAPVLDGGAVALRAALMPPLSTEQREAFATAADYIDDTLCSCCYDSDKHNAVEAASAQLRALLTTPSRPAQSAPSIDTFIHDQMQNWLSIQRTRCDGSPWDLKEVDRISATLRSMVGESDVHTQEVLDAAAWRAYKRAGERPADGWVPTTAQLPDGNRDVLIYIDAFLPCEKAFFDGAHFFIRETDWTSCTKAWRDIPPPFPGGAV